MSTLFLDMVNRSISAGWIVLVVLLLRLLFKKAPKWLHVLLWGMVAIRLVSPVFLISSWSLLPSMQNISYLASSSQSFDVETGMTPADALVNPYVGEYALEVASVSANQGLSIATALASFWVIGIVVLILYTGITYWKLYKKVSTAILLKENIFQSEFIRSPFVLGLIRPQIYLPFSLEPQEVRYVIAHEQAHIHRKDHWWKFFGFILLTIYWFHPLLWLAYYLLCQDIELACDEEVIREFNMEERAQYSQALLLCSIRRTGIAACPLAFGEIGVKERIKHVLNYRKPAFWLLVAAVCACTVAAVCFLTDPVHYTPEIQVNGVIYVQKGEKLSQLPEGSIEVGPLISIVHHTTDMPNENFSGTNLDAKYAGCMLYKCGADHAVILLEDYKGFYIPFIYEGTAVPWQWFDYYDRPEEMPWGFGLETEILSFPYEITFRWSPERMVMIANGEEKALFTGMPIWNTFFCDLTQDGKPELCATVSVDSGISGTCVVVYDVMQDQLFELSGRGKYDYVLFWDGLQVLLNRYEYSDHDQWTTGTLELTQHGNLRMVEQMATKPSLDDAISSAILQHNAGNTEDFIHVESHVVLDVQTSGVVLDGQTNDNSQEVTAYVLALQKYYHIMQGKLEEEGGSFIPTALTFGVSETGEYTLKQYWEPRDGSYYADDIRSTFPFFAAEEALHASRYLEELKVECEQKAQEYFNYTNR